MFAQKIICRKNSVWPLVAEKHAFLTDGAETLEVVAKVRRGNELRGLKVWNEAFAKKSRLRVSDKKAAAQSESARRLMFCQRQPLTE